MDVASFFDLVESTPGVNRRLNHEQRAAVASPAQPATMIVAGPGSGKTTVLVLRALRFVVVDRVPPECIVLTTFTIKAAKEIRSRLVEWGGALLEELRCRGPDLDPGLRSFLETADINRVITGTLDSICHEALSADREADEPPFTVLDPYAARVILQRRALSGVWNTHQGVLKAHVAPFTLFGSPPKTKGDVTAVVVPFVDRFIHDRVDVASYGNVSAPEGQRLLAEVSEAYRSHLKTESMLDFAMLEKMLLDRIESGRVPVMLQDVRLLLIDEYQDSNALQEAIYFALSKATDASLTVVGDDDQSLYRFRGATIELFRDFLARCRAALGAAPDGPLYLIGNYRSSPEIVSFYNRFIRNDQDFVPARISPPKPEIVAHNPSMDWPVMGMFRADPQTLADDLASFLDDVFRGGGFIDVDRRLPSPLRRATIGGDLGDAALLGFSVNEMSVSFGTTTRRFPGLLRDSLEARGMRMFNPRGRSLRDIEQVRNLLGLALVAIDPPQPTQRSQDPDFAVSREAKDFCSQWTDAAERILAAPPPDVFGRSLVGEIRKWQEFVKRGTGSLSESSDWPFLDVLYGILPFFPFFEDDPEGQVYLEAISRAASQTASFSPYRGRLAREQPHRDRSVDSVLRDVFVAVAEDMIDVDEEIMPSVPRDRLGVMTVHQAKGLEFPLVIVDVGGDLKTNHHTNRFRRFPSKASSVAEMEDHLANYTPGIGPLRTRRSALHRSFEDLIRLFYVAYSRPQAALLLVGCTSLIKTQKTVPSVATWWCQDQSWAWRPQTPGKPPPLVRPSDIVLI